MGMRDIEPNWLRSIFNIWDWRFSRQSICVVCTVLCLLHVPKVAKNYQCFGGTSHLVLQC